MSTITEGRMHNPAHPGEILQRLYLKPRKITQEEAAEAVGVSRKHMSEIINGRISLSPEMANKIAAALGTDCAMWINLQAQYDIWRMAQQPKPKVKSLRAADQTT